MAGLKLFELLGVSDENAAAKLWPHSRVRLGTGDILTKVPEQIVRYLQSVLRFHNVRPGAESDRVGLTADMTVDHSTEPTADLSFEQMPDVAFRLRTTVLSKPARVFVTQGDTGIELVVEALPVEIRLTSDLLAALPYAAPQTPDPLAPEHLDSLEVVLRQEDPSSIFVHVRVRMTEEMDFVIEPAVPISVGPCVFIGVPCRGLHDINFVPVPVLPGRDGAREQALEWTRHDLDGLALDARFPGVLTVRTVDLDEGRTPVKELLAWMNAKRKEFKAEESGRVEFVLEDIALPFANKVGLPVPAHGQFGMRRRIKMTDSAEDAFKFGTAPVLVELPWGWTLVIETLLLRTTGKLAKDPVINVDMAMVFGKQVDQPSSHAAQFAIADEWTLQLGWRSPQALELFTIVGMTFSLWGAKTGLSLARVNAGQDFLDCVQQLFDLSMKSSPSKTKGLFVIRSASNKPLDVALHDVGYNFGEFNIGKLTFPEGAMLVFGGVIGLVIDELGLVTENNGGEYFSFSGGIDWGKPLSKDRDDNSGIRFQRLRFLTNGPDDLPDVLLDGASLNIKIKTFSLSGYGSVSEFTQAGITYKEFGFGIRVEFDAVGKRYSLGLSLFFGTAKGAQDFKYWLFGFELGVIPCGTFDLVNVRVLGAQNMTPTLPAPTGYAPQMRLYRWYHEGGKDLVTLSPNDRRMGGWQRRDGSTSFGAGVGVSLPSGRMLRIEAFVFVFDRPDAWGVLVAVEGYLLKAKKPVAYGAVEIRNDGWGAILGVNLTLEQVVGLKLPNWFNPFNPVVLSGTLYMGDDPATFAIGQLKDPSTWLALNLEAAGFVEVALKVAFCFEYVDRDAGPKGSGFSVSLKGGASFGIGKVELYAAFGVLFGTWRNESTSGGVVFWVEGAFRVKLFYIFRFGISARIEVGILGQAGTSDSFRRLAALLTIETPWFLPDVSFRFERTWGKTTFAHIEYASAPLLAAAALDAHRRCAQPAAVTPAVGHKVDPAGVYTMTQLEAHQAPALPVGPLPGLELVAVDATVALDFKPAVDAVATTVPGRSDLGTEQATAPARSNLSVTYELVTIGIHRRPRRSAANAAWTDLLDPLDTKLEGPWAFSSPDEITARFAPKLAMRWQADQQRNGKPDQRQLLINADTPFSFLGENPTNDETAVRGQPGWPCCPTTTPQAPWYRLDFSATLFGDRVPRQQSFADSETPLAWLTRTAPLVAPSEMGSTSIHAARVRLQPLPVVQLASVLFDEPAAEFELEGLWPPGVFGGRLQVEAYRGLERTVTLDVDLSTPKSQPLRLADFEGMDSMLLRYAFTGADEARADFIEIHSMRYRTVREVMATFAERERCKQAAARQFPGAGKFAWLPNHDYAVRLEFRIVGKHASEGARAAKVEQLAYFSTKGLIGLNAVDRLGDDIEPHVEATYPGSAPVYREEPVAIAFAESFNVLLPVDRSFVGGNPEELNQFMEWVLVVDKVAGGETSFERVSRATPDWLTAHRTGPLMLADVEPPRLTAATQVASIREADTVNPLKLRLEALLMSPLGCNTSNPAPYRSQVLLHRPTSLHGTAAEQDLWEAGAQFRANLRLAGAAFVARTHFAEHDSTSFERRCDAGAAIGTWTVNDGVLRCDASSGRQYAVFGEQQWQYVQVHALIDPLRGAAGVAIAVEVGQGGIVRSLSAVVDAVNGTLRIEAGSGDEQQKLASTPLPAGASGPHSLELVAFDDRVRARIGETVVEAARGAFQAGKLALVTDGAADFGTLRVEGLDAYRFEFRSSRFRGFAEHIASFPGAVQTLTPALLNPQSAATTPASLYLQTHSSIASAMQPTAGRKARQQVFDRWVAGLGVPLRERVSRLEITTVTDAGKTSLLLIESPEPLAFSDEVTLKLERLVFVSVPGPGGPVLREPASGRHAFAEPPTAWQETTEPGHGPDVVARGSTQHEQVPPRVLANGPQTRALVMPVYAAGSQLGPLARGTYRLSFSLDRQRYRTNASDTYARYQRDASIVFNL